MSYTTKRNLTVTVDGERYRAEFDGEEVYVFDKKDGQHIAFTEKREQALEIAGLVHELIKQIGLTTLVVKEEHEPTL
ncbi:MAG: hypothetical protein C5B59_12770 [Bacteroidetes bacterium]|nr:MAG: hypothetical protein C5B59_12770 [Bacteroidota bacterium]